MRMQPVGLLAGAMAIAAGGAFGQSAAPGTVEAPLRPIDVEVVRRPGVSDYWHPKKAFTERVEGRADIVCLVTDAGRLTDCRVKSEDPTGYGFGEALVRQAQAEVRLARKAHDGAPVGGRYFGFGRIFRVYGDAPKTAAPIERPQARDDGLSQRWIQLINGELMQRCFRRAVDKPETVTVTVQCRTAEGDRLTDCRAVANSRAPDARYEAAAVCAVDSARVRVERPDGAPVVGAEVSVPLTYRVR